MFEKVKMFKERNEDYKKKGKTKTPYVPYLKVIIKQNESGIE